METGGHYYGLTVLQHCGGGAFGEVYYCRDASGKEVALKVVSKFRIGSNWQRELKGITFYRRLAENSPMLLRIYHVGEDDENFFYTMELADALPGHKKYYADTLAARLAAGPLAQADIIPILSAIFEGIKALHASGFAHRDIKPENILFINGKPKLADLGLLSPLSGTMTQLAGTLDFMPPEERIGDYTDSRESRKRNDLYAFGKIIYCCITGNRANAYPSMPPHIALTLCNKHFFRLALRLCAREPFKRLNSMENLQKEFARTVKICTHGEKLYDKLRYAVISLARNFRYRVVESAQFCRQYKLLTIMLLFLLLFAAAIVALVILPFATYPDEPQPETQPVVEQPSAHTTQPVVAQPSAPVIDPKKNAEIARRIKQDLSYIDSDIEQANQVYKENIEALRKLHEENQWEINADRQ